MRKKNRLDKSFADRAQKIMLAKDMGNKTEELKKLEIEESEDKVELENLNNELSKNPEGRAIRQFLYNYSDENLNVETPERFVKQQTELRADDAKLLEAWIMKDHVQLDNGLQILTSSANKETVDKLNLFIIYINSVKDGFIDHEENINYFNDLISEISNSLFNK